MSAAHGGKNFFKGRKEMKKARKITMVIVAILLVLSSLVIGTAALQTNGTMNITITADKKTNLSPGDIITYTVNIKSDFNSTGMRWPIMFQSNVLEMVTVNGNEGNVLPLAALSMPGSSLTSRNATGETEMHQGTYSSTAYGCLLVQWNARDFGGVPNYYYSPNGQNCFTFQLRVKSSGFSNNASAIVRIVTNIAGYSNQFYRQALEDVNFEGSFYDINLTVTPTNPTETVTAFNELPGLYKKFESLDVIIDDELGFIYGFTEIFTEDMLITLSSLENYFLRTTGGAKYTLTPNDMDEYSTGAMLHLTTADDVPIKDYSFVVFGDINGDFSVNAEDLNLSVELQLGNYEQLACLAELDSWEATDHPVLFAADVDFDYKYNMGTDYAVIIDHGLMGVGYINQTRTKGASGSPIVFW